MTAAQTGLPCRHLKAPTTDVDIMSAEASLSPWDKLRAMRSLGPVVWHQGYGRWMITTDQAVRSIITDSHHFTVEGTTVEELFGTDAFFAMDDPVRHDELRAVWTESFSMVGLNRLKPAAIAIIQQEVGTLEGRLQDGESVNVTTDFCRPIPTRIISHMMGVPDSVIPDIVRWTDAIGAGATTYLSPEKVREVEASREDAKAALATFLEDQLAYRRRSPNDDLISRLANSDVGKRLGNDRLVPNLRQLFFAGNDTTAKWLGHIMVTFAERPKVRREIAANRRLIASANYEILRWQNVAGSCVRRVRHGPIEVEGITMEDGDLITCLLASANRDPARYQRPDELDIHRPSRPHLGFGFGFHICLGAMLARMEAEITVNTMLDRLPEFTIAAPYQYTPLPIRGPTPVIINI